MPFIVPPPSDLLQIDRVADWLELVALVADDGSASASDFEQLLRREGTLDSGGHDVAERIEAQAVSVFAELESRARDGAAYYPFIVCGRLISRQKDAAPKFLPYLFCLCISYFEHGPNASQNGVNPRLLFEQVACFALAGYTGGDAKVFGTSRVTGISGFKAAVREICKFTGEGSDCRQLDTLDKKDDHIDLVAVKHFRDERPGKIVLFGQCATGRNWESKLSELNPDAFWNHWIEPAKVSEVLRSFFVPHEIPKNRWEYCAQYGGIVFDRRRLSHWAVVNQSGATVLNNLESWIDGCLRHHLSSPT